MVSVWATHLPFSLPLEMMAERKLMYLRVLQQQKTDQLGVYLYNPGLATVLKHRKPNSESFSQLFWNVVQKLLRSLLMKEGWLIFTQHRFHSLALVLLCSLTHRLQTLGCSKAMLDASTGVEFKLCNSGPNGSSRLLRRIPLLMPDCIPQALPWIGGQLRTEPV